MADHAAVIVNGSSSIKAGFSGDDVPTAVFPNMHGKPHYPAWIARCQRGTSKNKSASWQQKLDSSAQDSYVGDDAQELRGILSLQYPMERGIIHDWDAMEDIWQHTFKKELKIDAKQRNVMMTEAPLNPKVHRARLFETMFETFQVPALYVENPAWLALMGSSRKTGLILHVGDGVTHTLAIYEGYEIVEATQRINLGGGDVTKYLLQLLSMSNGSGFVDKGLTSQQWKYKWVPTMRSDFEIVKEIKEERCFVSIDADADDQLAERGEASIIKDYELPDGRTISIGSERFKCCEALFKPSLVGSELPGMHDLLLRAVDACEWELRNQLLQNVVISGGATVAPGFAQRLANELKYSSPSGMTIHIDAPKERKYSAWIGGAVLSSLSAFKTKWVTRREYEEHGASIIHRKCPSYGPR